MNFFQAIEQNAFHYPPSKYDNNWLLNYQRNRWDFIDRISYYERIAASHVTRSGDNIIELHPGAIYHARPNPYENTMFSEPIVDGRFNGMLEQARKRESAKFDNQGIGPQHPDAYFIEQVNLLRDRIHLFVHSLIWENEVPESPQDGAFPDLDAIWLSITNIEATWNTMFASLDGRRHLAYALIGEALRKTILIKKPIDDPAMSYAMDAFLASVAGGASGKNYPFVPQLIFFVMLYNFKYAA